LRRYNEDANIRLIDNDQLLGQQVLDKAGGCRLNIVLMVPGFSACN
jgi:hypothetical protein